MHSRASGHDASTATGGANTIRQQCGDLIDLWIDPEARAGEPQMAKGVTAGRRTSQRAARCDAVEAHAQCTPRSKSQKRRHQGAIGRVVARFQKPNSESEQRFQGTKKPCVPAHTRTREGPGVVVVHDTPQHPATRGQELSGGDLLREVGHAPCPCPCRADGELQGVKNHLPKGSIQGQGGGSLDRFAKQHISQIAVDRRVARRAILSFGLASAAHKLPSKIGCSCPAWAIEFDMWAQASAMGEQCFDRLIPRPSPPALFKQRAKGAVPAKEPAADQLAASESTERLGERGQIIGLHQACGGCVPSSDMRPCERNGCAAGHRTTRNARFYYFLLKDVADRRIEFNQCAPWSTRAAPCVKRDSGRRTDPQRGASVGGYFDHKRPRTLC